MYLALLYNCTISFLVFQSHFVDSMTINAMADTLKLFTRKQNPVKIPSSLTLLIDSFVNIAS